MERISEKFYTQADLKIKEVERQEDKAINRYLEKGLVDDAKRDGSYPFYAIQIQAKLSENLLRSSRLLEQQTALLEETRKQNELSEFEKIRLARYDNKRKQKLQKAKNKRLNKKTHRRK